MLEIRVDPEVQRRVDELADKNSEGELTAEERAEYETLLNVGMVISLLQTKARELRAMNTQRTGS